MQLITTFGTTAVKAKTVDKSGIYQLSDKNCHVGLNVGGAHPRTSNWSSSDLKIATVYRCFVQWRSHYTKSCLQARS